MIHPAAAVQSGCIRSSPYGFGCAAQEVAHNVIESPSEYQEMHAGMEQTLVDPKPEIVNRDPIEQFAYYRLDRSIWRISYWWGKEDRKVVPL